MPTARQLFLRHLAQTSAFPLMLEVKRASGIYLFDNNDKPYIDLIAGIGVSCLGHCPPEVVKAAKYQLDLYLHTMVYGEYILTPQVKLAQLLTSQLPDSLNSVYFVNSGTEATEGAMKLAKRYTGRAEIISCYQAYHGSTQGAASLNSEAFFTQAFRPLLPGIKHIRFNSEPCLKLITNKTACVIIEPIQAEAGVKLPKDGFLKKLRQRCNETGTLLVFDEIQTGFGRTGSLFAFEQFEVVPDILLIAKGMGGGMPIGAFIANKKLMETLSFEPILGHITTFGGHPVCCAAALATLETLLKNKLFESVKAKENLCLSLLQHPSIKAIRSAGLLMAIELENFETIQLVVRECLGKGLVTDWFLFNNKCLRIAPPLIINEAEIKAACTIINDSIEIVTRKMNQGPLV